MILALMKMIYDVKQRPNRARADWNKNNMFWPSLERKESS